MITMSKEQEPRRRRKRGVILTKQGLKKLLQAKAQAEERENGGYRYTLETLSDRTGLAVDTLMKVFACEMGVDKKTLKDCFKAFNLVLETGDFYRREPEIEAGQTWQLLHEGPELPEGQVPLHSDFYVERSPIESECYKAILQPGALIRIKAPRRMGKTSLMMRILTQAARQRYNTVALSLQLADSNLLQNLDKFLQWFCANVTLGLQLPNKLSDYWDDMFGSKISCKIYFEEYLLAKTNPPIILALDDVDRLFQYRDLADDFFGLLRAWHEEAKNREIWQKLRLIVAHSTEVYIPLNVNQSPFNVGLPIELPTLTAEQVFNLAHKHQLDWSMEQAEKFCSFVGGNPYLIRLAMYHIWHEDTTLEELLTDSPMSDDNIYRHHLTRQLWNLQQQNEGLEQGLAKVVLSSKPIELDLIQAFQLQSLGLVRFQSKGNTVSSSCQLYTQYFQAYFEAKNNL
ncbi:AAA-like domain-containing protein [Gloeothece verrucosa]|uniref:Serine/threonine protein kinase n=1 Tax=Gloeothece verrucosa (strain PCC 7822) TaxID=497965 RepID=E0UJR6_GLOV7|nr:conserved hypothetical protein [Gloeothece verrucosa PCC 7822]